MPGSLPDLTLHVPDKYASSVTPCTCHVIQCTACHMYMDEGKRCTSSILARDSSLVKALLHCPKKPL